MGFDEGVMAEVMVCGDAIGSVQVAGFLVGVAPGMAKDEFGLFDGGAKA